MELVRSIDPTRLIDATTGWNDHGAGDFSVSRLHVDELPEERSWLTKA